MNFEVTIDKDRCKACAYCISACRQAVLKMSRSLNRKGYHFPETIKIEACIGCQRCTVMCPDTAIRITRRKSSGSPRNHTAEKK